LHNLKKGSTSIINTNVNTGRYSITTPKNHNYKKVALIVYNNAVLPLLVYMIYFQKWPLVMLPLPQ